MFTRRLMMTLLATASLSAPAVAAGPAAVIHRHMSTDQSYESNAFWLETAEGIVLIDALLLNSDARLLAAQMRATGKPLQAIVLTHPHLDHFGGIREVRDAFGEVPVYATAATAEAIRPTLDQALADGWPQGYGADFNPDVYLPDHRVESDTELDIGGLKLVITDLGPGEAANNSVVFVPLINALFTGDATVAHGFYYVGEGRATAARQQLEEIGKRYGDGVMVYSGHYDHALSHEVIEDNRAQLDQLEQLATAAVKAGSYTSEGRFTDAARSHMVSAIVERWPGKLNYGLPPRMVPTMNVLGMEKQLATEAAGEKS